MSKTDRVPFFVHVFSGIVARLLGAGIPMGPLVLLTVRGRTTGQPRTTPVALLEHDGHRWLVGTFGEVSWTRNLRAAGAGILTHGRRRQAVVAVELSPQAAGPVLKDAVAPHSASRMIAAVLRRYLDVAPDASLNDFITEARRHPVFELSGSQAAEPTGWRPTGPSRRE
jgi:deazaflavin-dependent oxidoreductase (nitroreductase family)